MSLYGSLALLISALFCTFVLLQLRVRDEDKLEPPSQNGFISRWVHPFVSANLGNYGGIRVRVRVSRIWVAFNPNTGTEFGLDCLLIDEEVIQSIPQLKFHCPYQLTDDNLTSSLLVPD